MMFPLFKDGMMVTSFCCGAALNVSIFSRDINSNRLILLSYIPGYIIDIIYNTRALLFDKLFPTVLVAAQGRHLESWTFSAQTAEGSIAIAT